MLSLDQWKKGTIIEVPGFAPAVEAWPAGGRPNYGFLVQFWGKSLQVGIPSREAKPPAAPSLITLGGARKQTAVLNIDLALLPLTAAWRRPSHGGLATTPAAVPRANKPLPNNSPLRAPTEGWSGEGSGVRAGASTATHPLSDAILNIYLPKPGGDGFATTPLASAPVAKADGEGRLLLPGLESLLLASGDKLPLLLAADVAAPATLQVFGASSAKARQPAIQAVVKAYPRATLFAFDLQPQPGVYCKVQSGHLNYGGRRLRLWAPSASAPWNGNARWASIAAASGISPTCTTRSRSNGACPSRRRPSPTRSTSSWQPRVGRECS